MSWLTKTIRPALYTLLPWLLSLAGTPALAYTNTIQIFPNPERLWQCGDKWDPERTGHWSGATGRIYLYDKLVRQYDLRNQEECNKVTTVSIDADKDQEIVMTIENEFGRYVYRRYTVAGNRLWKFTFFSDSHGLYDVSTDWDNSPSKSTPSTNNSSGYELFFNGKRVSGPDARYYTEKQARDNCAWNVQTKPSIRVECYFNGVQFR